MFFYLEGNQYCDLSKVQNAVLLNFPFIEEFLKNGSLYKNILKLATKRMAYRREEENRDKSDDYITLKREKSE